MTLKKLHIVWPNKDSSFIRTEMPLEFLVTTKKRDMLLYKNFFYHRWSTNYWRCRDRACSSSVSKTGETQADDIKRTSPAWHNHLEHSLVRTCESELLRKSAFYILSIFFIYFIFLRKYTLAKVNSCESTHLRK